MKRSFGNRGSGLVARHALAIAVAAFAWAALVPALARAATFSNPSSIALNDPATGNPGCTDGVTCNAPATPYPSTISVSGLTGTVNDVTLTLNNASYAYSEDLDVLLVAPNGSSLIPVSFMGPDGAPGDGDPSLSDSTTTFSDAGTTPTAGTQWGTGNTFTPANFSGFNQVWESPAPPPPYGNPGPDTNIGPAGASFASQFNGINPNGTWSLYVITTSAGDGTGAIAGGWTLNITTASATPTTTALASNPNPSFTSGSDSSVTLTATVSSSGSTVNEGVVNFTDGGTTIGGCGGQAVSNGQATCTTTFATEGSHPLEALYAGDANFGPSTGSLSQGVNDHTTVTGSQYCNTGSILLNNPNIENPEIGASPYPSNIFVSSLPTTLGGLTVTLNNVTYPESQDIDGLLVGPGGQSFILVAAAGPNSGGAISSVTLTLDDTAGSPLPSNTGWGAPNSSVTARPVDYGGNNESWGPPAPAGPYGDPAPTGSSTLDGTFGGTNPNGTWSLYLITTQAGDGVGAAAGGWCVSLAATQAPGATPSAPASPSITLGSGETDNATVTGNATGGSPTGSVGFAVCGPLTSATGCASGGTPVGSAVGLTAGSGNTATATSAAFTPPSPGTYCFAAQYSGDSNYAGSGDTSADECFTVTQASSGTSSAPASPSVVVGSGETDNATVTGNATGGSPTGSVGFAVCGPLTSATGCASGGTPVGSAVGLTAGAGNTATATSAAFNPPSPGTYCFAAQYSGDSNYTGSGDTSVDECFTAVSGGPPAVTSVSPRSGPVTGGTSITINGTGFGPGDAVVIGQGHGAGKGAIPATGLTITPTQITATTGGGAQGGTWNVYVVNGSAQSATVGGDRFTYISPPTVTSVSPSKGPVTGGTTITITGTEFGPGDEVVIGQGHGAGKGAIPATGLTITPTQITATTGGGAQKGAYYVFVIAPNNGGTSQGFNNAQRFTYTPG